MDRYGDERVLVVSRSLFDKLGSFQGLETDVDRYLPVFLDPENNYFLPRGEAEDDPSHKQLIPYAVFVCGDRVLRYVRGSGSGEQRLAAKASIGIGGHINTSDVEQGGYGRDTYNAGVDREIDEELQIAGSHSHRITALINDDSNAVGQVHLGVVHLVQLENEEVKANENEITDIAFLTIGELQAERNRLETWSQLCLDGLFEH